MKNKTSRERQVSRQKRVADDKSGLRHADGRVRSSKALGPALCPVGGRDRLWVIIESSLDSHSLSEKGCWPCAFPSMPQWLMATSRLLMHHVTKQSKSSQIGFMNITMRSVHISAFPRHQMWIRWLMWQKGRLWRKQIFRNDLMQLCGHEEWIYSTCHKELKLLWQQSKTPSIQYEHGVSNKQASQC